MNRRFVIRAIQITLVALTAAAIVQELSKPKKERRWHGKVMGFIPYDFRLPTWERFKETYWNPYERHVLTPRFSALAGQSIFMPCLKTWDLFIKQISRKKVSLCPTNACGN